MKDYTPTPHNAARLGDIASTVLMSGDPLRSKFIAENFLEGPVQYNGIRGMLGYTGTYKGRRISVQGHGMGIPSMGIYSYELYAFYGVDTIIRLGTCGTPDPSVKTGTIVLAETAVTDSNFGYQYDLPEGYVAKATPELLEKAAKAASALGIDVLKGTVFSSDVFYDENGEFSKRVKEGIVGLEMESYALYTNAYAKGGKALTILTVTDNAVTGEALPAEERQNGMSRMIELALSM